MTIKSQYFTIQKWDKRDHNKEANRFNMNRTPLNSGKTRSGRGFAAKTSSESDSEKEESSKDSESEETEKEKDVVTHGASGGAPEAKFDGVRPKDKLSLLDEQLRHSRTNTLQNETTGTSSDQ